MDALLAGSIVAFLAVLLSAGALTLRHRGGSGVDPAPSDEGDEIWLDVLRENPWRAGEDPST